MSNHPVASTQWIRAKGQGTFHRGLRMDRLAVSLAQYFLFGTGFATRVPAMGTAFTKSEPGLDAPDLQFYCGGGGFRAHEWFPVREAAGARRLRPHLLPFAAGEPRRGEARLGRSAGADQDLQ